MKLSKTQQAVLDKMDETGQPLVRWPGGFWSYKGCTVSHQGKLDHGTKYSVPSWYCSAGTIKALDDRGLIKRLNVFPENWRDHRGLVTGGQPTAGASPKKYWFSKETI
jgi:hypothetical protein